MSEKIASTDVNAIKKLVDMMKENDLVELKITDDKTKIHLRRPEPKQPEQVITHMPPMHMPAMAHPQMPMQAAAVADSSAGAAASAAKEELPTINSPIVGTFYSAPTPESPPFIKVGDIVNEDTVVCIVEAMKVMNEIKAEISGTITEVCVSNGQAIEFGQPLFKVKPN